MARIGRRSFAILFEAAKSLPVKSAILDGEVVVVDAQGHSSFQKLQRSMGKGVTAGFVFEVFDLIYLDGFNLTKTPLRERKVLLKDVFKSTGSGGTLRYSEHLEGDGRGSPVSYITSAQICDGDT